MTTLNRNSKADTVFLGLKGDGGPDDMAVDISQERTDLDYQTTYLREDSSARTAITTPREISLLFVAKTGDSGILINHGTNDGASYTFRIDITGGALRCLENGSVRCQVNLPGLAGSDREFVAQWSTRPEGSQVRSELIIINDTIGTLAFSFATHAVCTTSTSWNLQVAGYGNGASSAYDIGDINGVRIGKRAHSMPEAIEDWRAESTKPTLTATTRDAVLPIDADTDIAAVGGFAGPAYLFGGAAARDADRRLVSPLVNVRAPAEFNIAKADHTDGSRKWFRPTPDDPAFYLSAQHFHYVPVPPNVSRAQVRIFVRVHTIDAGPCDMLFAAYSAAGWPFAGEPAQDLTYHRTGNTICNTDHPSGGGEWLDLGDVQIARDDWGMSSFMIAHSFDNGDDSEAADETLFSILAIIVEPFSAPASSGPGLGFDQEP